MDLGGGCRKCTPLPGDDPRLSNTTSILQNMQICIICISSFYVTSQLRHFLVVHPFLRKTLDPPLEEEDLRLK